MTNHAGGRTSVVRFRLRPEKAQQIVQDTAKDTAMVILGRHALERIEEREISDIEVYRLLQTGNVMDEPELTKKKEWKCKVVNKIRGIRDAAVIVIILRGGKLFIKTVEWED